MKRVALSLVIALSGIVSIACGGSTDSGLFSAGDGSAADSAAPPSGDAQPGDSSVPIEDASAAEDTSTPPIDAPVTPVDAGGCPTVDTNGKMDFTVENNASFSLGNTTWAQHGQNGADDMEATYGAKCDGEASFTLPN